MQSKGAIKLLAILLAIACIYQLSFTLVTHNVEKKADAYAAKFDADQQPTMRQYFIDSVSNTPVYNLGFKNFTYKEVKEKEVNLGLDLKGGMNVMLEIQVQDVIKSLAGDSAQDKNFIAAMKDAEAAQTRGGDFLNNFVKSYEKYSGGAPLATIFVSPDRKDITMNSSNDEVEKVLRKTTDDAINASYKILRSRIDHFGVTQPNIQRLPNSNRVLVELPGVKEPERVRKLLQGSASLEFWTTYNAYDVLPQLARADELLRSMNVAAPAANEQVEVVAEEVAPVADTTASAVDALAAQVSTAAPESVEPQDAADLSRETNPLFALLDTRYAGGAAVGAAMSANKAAIDAYLAMPEVKAVLPSDVVFKWGIKGDDRMEGRYLLYAIKVERPDGKAPLDGSVITRAEESYSQKGATAEVSMSMNSYGMAEWARLTGDNVNKCIAIVLDGYVYSAPVVNGKIEGGSSAISGDFTIQEAKDLANVLESGKVPAPARIIQDTVVGPSLGQESIDAGLVSFLIAFILVLLYMGLFYKTAGWLADVALLCNVFLLMGVLVSFGAVLTLPGIAGIVLTMGMAVDANVIIFERVKEELRAGKALLAAIKDGFSNAYSAIIDGNVTTLITGIVLVVFGTGPVQGFATTLIIGIITSLFCAIFITRLLIESAVERFGGIKFYRKWSQNWMANASFDFIGKRKVAYAISSLLILTSLTSIAVRQFNLGVEFTGGRTYVIRFDKNVTAEEVRSSLEKTFIGGDAAKISFEVKQYGEENQMRVVTQYKYDDTSEQTTAEIDEMIYNAVKGLYSYDISFEAFRNTQYDINGIISADKIGPSIAKDMTYNAIYSILFSLLAIGLYITVRFKKWQWASGAVVSLMHDTIIVLGLFSLFYGILPFNLEINQAFIAALLTIIGYSINDTVIIFDRIRELLHLYPKHSIKRNINEAVNSTLPRTINTSGTTLVTLFAIFFFGGETIRGFVFALLSGILIGTYSSIFVATPIAYDMLSRKEQSKNDEAK